MRARAGRAEDRDLRRGQVARGEHAGAQRVVDVVVDVGDAVDEPHDLALERRRLARRRVWRRMPSRTGSVRLRPRPSRSSTSTTRSECSLWRKPRPKRSRSAASSAVLAGVPERRVAEVVAEPDRLGQVLVEPQRARDGARDPRRLERVGEPRAVVIALGRDEDLRLVLEPPERLGVDDPVAVALERGAQPAGSSSGPAARFDERTASGDSHASSPPLARGEGVGDRSSGPHAPGRFYWNLPSAPGTADSRRFPGLLPGRTCARAR